MRYKKIIAAAAAAVMILSGCDTGTPDITDAQSSDTTTSEVTEQPAETAENTDEQVFFEYSEVPDGVVLTRYVNEEIVVPETINGKPVTAFRGNSIQDTNIKKLKVKARLETIPVLCESPYLTEIDLPSSMTTVLPSSFINCKALEAVNVEPGGELCSVDGAVYTADMKKLLFVPYAAGEEITIPEGVEIIADCAMQYSEAKKVTLPSTLKEIGQFAFSKSKLESVDIPAGVKKIGSYAFNETKIKEITFPNGLETIGSSVFTKTYIEKLYIPDSVTECGMDAMPSCPVSAPAQLADTYALSAKSYVSFRGVSMLDNAIRQGIAKFKENFVFKDITFDGFPELIAFGSRHSIDVYFYNTETKVWEDSYYSNFDNLEVLDGWVNREMWNILKENYPSGYSFYAIPTEDFIGKIEFYRVNKTGKLMNRVGKLFYFEDGKGVSQASNLFPEDCTLLWELNKETAKEKYDPLGTYIVFDGPFTDKPNGEIVSEFTAKDEVITEMPYVMNLIPKSENVYVNGSDILHGGSYEGVSYDYDNKTLILDNVTIETTDKNGISIMGIEYSKIKLIGDNRVVSAAKPSIEAFERLFILGDGTLTTGSISILTKSYYYGISDLTIEEKATLKEAYSGAFSDSSILTLSLQDQSRLICGTADEPSHGLRLDKLTVTGNAVCDINSFDYGISNNDELHAPIEVNTYGNGKLNITSTLDGITNGWHGGGEVYLNGNSEVTINAGRAGIDIDYGYGTRTASGTVSLSDSSKLTVRSRTACVRGHKLSVNGGMLDLKCGEGFNAVAIKTEIDGEVEYQEGGYGDDATQTLKLKVKAVEPEYDDYYEGAKAKPVIYLYPEEETDVSVQVSFPFGGEFTCTYPDYGGCWNVTAKPDGTLYDADGNEYYCLYWEGVGYDPMTGEDGFCVAGADTAAFLREKLMYIGLTAREANEFIIYWLPKMQYNPYNIISLYTEEYAECVPLDVSPMPDTQIRVFMTYRASDTPVDIPAQELPHYERTGFTLVEWGGREG